MRAPRRRSTEGWRQIAGDIVFSFSDEYVLDEERNCKIHNLFDTKIVALVCTDKGIVENKQYTLPEDTFIDEVVKTSEIINKMLIGIPINEVSQRLEFDIKPIIAKKVKQYEQVYSIFYDAFNDFAKNTSNFHMKGQTKLLHQREFQNSDDVKRILSKFEDDNIIKKIESKDDGINVYIGDDSNIDKDVTVIKTTYHKNGAEGTIAVIGPKRMEYDRVISLLKYISDNLQD